MPRKVDKKLSERASIDQLRDGTFNTVCRDDSTIIIIDQFNFEAFGAQPASNRLCTGGSRAQDRQVARLVDADDDGGSRRYPTGLASQWERRCQLRQSQAPQKHLAPSDRHRNLHIGKREGTGYGSKLVGFLKEFSYDRRPHPSAAMLTGMPRYLSAGPGGRRPQLPGEGSSSGRLGLKRAVRSAIRRRTARLNWPVSVLRGLRELAPAGPTREHPACL